MGRAVHAEVAKADKRINRRLAFGVFAAPVAWLIHETAAIAIIGRNCQQSGELLGWQWIALIGLTVFGVGLALAGGVVAYRVFRQWRNGASLIKAEGWDRVEFLSLFGVFVSALLLLNILYFGVMPLVVEPCLRVI